MENSKKTLNGWRIAAIIVLILCVVFGVLYGAGLLAQKKTAAQSQPQEQKAEPEKTPDKLAADYADPANWAWYETEDSKPADLFLICPTVDMNDEFNMSLSDEKTKASFLGALNMERAIYEDSARLFAPYYRQAAMKVYSLDRTEWEQYMQIAYTDVSTAFRYYLENENNGRPIILAGFSQGADICYRLMGEYFGDEALQDQLVAVYAIG